MRKIYKFLVIGLCVLLGLSSHIDDILIFSKNMEDHEHHVHLVLEKLWEAGFYAKLERYEFHQFEVEFLGYVIFGNGIRMDFHKVQTIVD